MMYFMLLSSKDVKISDAVAFLPLGVKNLSCFNGQEDLMMITLSFTAKIIPNFICYYLLRLRF